jgi:oligoribonuclease NrnB/cAMP/cGMP phosphodiesterase (DHH superfamily)
LPNLEQKNKDELLKERFHVSEVKRIERKDNPDTISNKWADFSFRTIREMISDGYIYYADVH